jgi:uncharacterized protein
MRLLGLALLLLAGCGGAPEAAQAVACRAAGESASVPPEILPRLTGRVVDEAELLSPAEEAALGQRSAALEARTTDQLVVATMPSLHGRSIEAVARALGSQWGIGQEDKDNGVLILVAPSERRVRIEVGYGLEPILTNARAQEIIDRDMLPQFGEGRMHQAIAAGTDSIVRLLADHASSPRVGCI